MIAWLKHNRVALVVGTFTIFVAVLLSIRSERQATDTRRNQVQVVQNLERIAQERDALADAIRNSCRVRNQNAETFNDTIDVIWAPALAAATTEAERARIQGLVRSFKFVIDDCNAYP